MIRENENIIWVIEDSYEYSRTDILSLLKGNRDTFEYLLESAYLYKNSKEGFCFKFVGVITIGKILICCLPKYYYSEHTGNKSIVSDFVNIIKVLKEVGKTDSLPDSTVSSTNIEINSSEIVLADKLLKDFILYGFFDKWQEIVSLNSDGETDWNYTVARIDPVFSKGSPIYHEVYSSEVVSENRNLIKAIHKWAVNYCYKKYRLILDYSFWYDKDCVEELQNLGSLDYLKNAILKELSISYIDRNIGLLKALLHLVENTYYSTEETFSIYGTGSFHVVWEHVCSWAFNNKIQDFNKYIPKPTWHDFSGNKKEQSTFIPDIVTRKENDIYVFDAKYYNFSHKEDVFDVLNTPGISDVSKQFLYAEIFAKQLQIPIFNCFLFPKIQEELYVLIGYVKLPILFDDSFVYNIHISPRELFDIFLKKESNPLILEDIKSCVTQIKYAFQ